MSTKNKKNPIASSVPKRSQDAITRSLIEAVSKQPTKTPAQQKKKNDTVKKLTSSLTSSTPAKSRSGVKVTSPSVVKGQRQEAAQKPASTPSISKVQRQQEMNIKGIVGSKSPELSNKLSNSLSLGTGLKKPEDAAGTAVDAIRNDDSSLARKVYNTQNGLSGGLSAGDFQRTAGSATRTGALASSGISDPKNTAVADRAKQKAAAAPDNLERAADENPLLMRAAHDIGEHAVSGNLLTQALYNIATRNLGADNQKSLSDRVDGSGASKALASAIDYSDRIKGRYLGGALQAVEDTAGAVSSYGNKALAAGANAIGATGAAEKLNAAAEKTVSDGLFGNQGAKYQEYLTEKYDGKSGIVDSVAQNIGYMTPSLMASYLTAGASTAAQGVGALGQTSRFASFMSSMAGGNTGLAVMAVQQAQSSANEAYHEGASLNQSLAYGAAAGMLSAVTERIAGGIPGLPEGTVTSAITSRISSPAARTAVTFALDKLGEGFEEVAETAISPYLKRAIYNPDAPAASAEELADSMLMGVMVSAILGAPSDLSNLSNLRSGYRGTQTDGSDSKTLEAVRDAVDDAQRWTQEGTQQAPESAQERANSETRETIPGALNDAQRASAAQDNRANVETQERADVEQVANPAETATENVQERAKTDTRETAPGTENGTQSASAAFENPIAQMVYNRSVEQNMPTEAAESASADPVTDERAQLAQRIEGMSEAELYQAVKDGDVSFDDLVSVLNYQAEQNVFDPEVLHQSTDEINADIDAGAYSIEELYDVIQAHNDSVDQMGAGQKIDASQMVQDVLAQSAETPSPDVGFSEAEQIADVSHDDVTARYLKGKIADVARAAHQLNSVYSNAIARDGTILGRKEFTSAMYNNLNRALRDMEQRMAAPDSPQSRAMKYRDVNIQYDINDANQDIQPLLEAWDDYYIVEQELNDLIAEKFKANADGRPSTDRQIAEACVKHGDISYLWSSYQKDVPTDVDAIVRYYELKTAMNDINRPQRAYNRSRMVAESALAHEMCEGVDRAHDKKGIQLNVKSPRRVLESVYKHNPEMAEKVYQAYFAPLTHGSALANAELEADRQKVADTGLGRREQQYTQMYMDNDARVANQVAEFKEKYQRRIDEGKVEEAAAVIKELLDDIHPKVNQALVRNGYRPMGKLDNYSPHFEEQLTGIQNALRRVGWYHPTSVRFTYADDVSQMDYETRQPGELPTTIAGRTEEFRGRHKWSGNIKQRTGFHTDYNIYTALESYLPNMLDIIYKTDGISHLRAYENQIRYETASADIQQSYERILAEDSTDPITKQQQIEELFKSVQGFDDTASKAQRLAKRETPANNLSGYVTWVRRYTDAVAGKKSIEDRCMEYTLGRTAYKNVSSTFDRIARNMVTTFSSTATNLVPIAQVSGEVGPVHLASAMMDTAKNAFSSDGFTDMSDFLVNRRAGGTSLTTSAIGRAADKLQVVDQFCAQVVTRAYYKQALGRGLSHSEALDFANRRAGDLMADRDSTQLPLMFQSSNPLQKALTLFQVEVNNNVQHVFHDLPRRAAEEGAAMVYGGFVVSSLAVAGFNALFEEIFGYTPEHFSPVEWLIQFLDWDKDDDEEKDTLYENLLELVGNVADATPVVSNFTGGGRIPLTSAIPGGSLSGALESAKTLVSSDSTLEERKDVLLNDMSRPVATLLFPAFGNQIRKTALGLTAMAEGGSYSVDKDGKRVLEVPFDRDDPVQWLQAAISGKTALPQMQDYYDGKTKRLNADQTAVFDAVKNGDVDVGLTPMAFYQLQQQVNDIEGDKDEDGNTIDGTREYHIRQLIDSYDHLNVSQKKNLDYLLIGQRVDDSARYGSYRVPGIQSDAELYLASTLSKSAMHDARIASYNGLSWNTIRDVLEETKDLGAVYVVDPRNTQSDDSIYYLSAQQNKLLAICDMDISEDEKKLAAQYLITEKAADYDFSTSSNLAASMILTDSQRERMNQNGLSSVSQDDLVQAAVQINFDWNSYQSAYGDAVDTDKDDFVRFSLYGNEQFSAEQKKEIGKILFDDPDSMRYDDKNTIKASLVSASCGNKWAMAYHFGFSIDEYTAAWKAAGSGSTKAEKVAAIVDATGMSSSRANSFVSKVYYAKSSVAAQYSIGSDGSVSFSGSGTGASGKSYYWNPSGYRRSSGRSSGGGGRSGGSASSAAGSKVWSNAAYTGYSNDEYAAAYDAASMFDTPAEKIKSVMNHTGWSWLKASTFVNLI